MLTLFHAPGTCSLASLILLKELELDHEVHLVNTMAGGTRTPEFLAINPKGRVPALKTEQGILTETVAILLYLAQIAPQAGLAPLNDPFALLTCRPSIPISPPPSMSPMRIVRAAAAGRMRKARLKT